MNPFCLTLILLASICLACNGDSRLCDRRYSSLVQIGTHNSAFIGITPINNQYISVTDQLDMGVRFLQVQTRSLRGGIGLCHTSCWTLNAGSLDDFLAEVAAWVNGHEEDVVTLLVTNSDGIPVEQFGLAFQDAGLGALVFRPKSFVELDEWPTLREFLNNGVKLIVFMGNYTDTEIVEYILPEFEYQWQNPFDETDSSFSNCSIDRPKHLRNSNPDGYMYMINHYLDFELPFGIKAPDQLHAGQTNSLESITRQADLCKERWGTAPNVILLDWVNVGQAIEAQQLLNGLA
ncbi:hypothetical protein TD95_004906 [Thielaviopsis punctulata]|uniref:Phosphatidylinositol-specific phospholipase C X domain-containing protein n=1 Tax=Thielaviopsis punctulata TaxID=72032 RepID=A0A0F4ZDP0_9PEZI|nr:hypothetical protein TD95_004906 [Thielaviopsis punctulata]